MLMAIAMGVGLAVDAVVLRMAVLEVMHGRGVHGVDRALTVLLSLGLVVDVALLTLCVLDAFRGPPRPSAGLPGLSECADGVIGLA